MTGCSLLVSGFNVTFISRALILCKAERVDWNCIDTLDVLLFVFPMCWKENVAAFLSHITLV